MSSVLWKSFETILGPKLSSNSLQSDQGSAFLPLVQQFNKKSQATFRGTTPPRHVVVELITSLLADSEMRVQVVNGFINATGKQFKMIL